MVRRLTILLALVALLQIGTGGTVSAAQQRDATLQLEALVEPPSAPFSAVPVQVTATSGRAARGVITIQSGRDGPPITYEIPVDLPASTPVSISVTVLSTYGGIDLSATLAIDGTDPVSERLQRFPSAMPGSIGVLGLEAPSVVSFSVGGREAAAMQLDDSIIVATGLRHVEVVAASPAALRDLGPAEQEIVLGWVGSGGSLVVAGASGSIDGLLPAEWQADGLPGAGSITYPGIDWQDGLRPTQSNAANLGGSSQSAGVLGRGFDGNYSPATDLVGDAGLRLPGIGLLLSLLGAYILIAGPVAYLLLRRFGRPTSAWGVLPAVALLFTAGAIFAGFSLRGDRSDAHATIIEVQPIGSTARSDVLYTATLRGDRTVVMPQGWNLIATGDNWGGGGSVPITVRPNRTSTELTLGLEAGGAALLAAAGPATGFDQAIVISDVRLDGSVITGSVKNNLAVDVHEVLAFAGRGVGEVGTVPAGTSAAFKVEFESQFDGQAGEFQFWPRPISRWDGRGANDETDISVVGSSSWASWRHNDGWNTFSSGSVGVVGWSDEIESVALGIAKGRTGLVARAQLPAATEPASREAATRHVVVSAADDGNGGFFEAQNFFGFQFSSLVDLTDGDPSDVALAIGENVAALEFWTESGWMAAALPVDGDVVILVPPEATQGTDMLVRTSVPEWTHPMQPGVAVVSAASAEATDAFAVTLRSGAPSFRSVQGSGEFGPFGPFGIPEPIPIRPAPIPRAEVAPSESDTGETLGVDQVLSVGAGAREVIGGQLGFDEYDIFRVAAEPGEAMTVGLETESDLSVQVLTPDGDIALNELAPEEVNRIQVTVRESGMYIIEVRASAQGRDAGDIGSYLLEVERAR